MRHIMRVFLAAAVVGGTLATAQPAGRAASSYQNITPSQLNTMLRKKDFVLVNVHIPYAGQIRGTDLFVPYTEMAAKAPQLLPDKQARVVVYCQTGRMSGIAADALVRMGYTRVLNLAGGMVAWERSGYALVRR